MAHKRLSTAQLLGRAERLGGDRSVCVGTASSTRSSPPPEPSTNNAATAAGSPTPRPLTACNGPPRIVALGVGDGVVVPTRNDPDDGDEVAGGDERAGVPRLGATTGPVD